MMYLSTLIQAHPLLHGRDFIKQHVVLTLLGSVALLGIIPALHLLISEQIFSRLQEPFLVSADPEVLTFFDNPLYVSEYPARTQYIINCLITLKDRIGAERVYALTYTARDRLPGTEHIAQVLEVDRAGVPPTHQRLQGVYIASDQLAEEVGYNTYDVLPYIYGRELYDNDGRKIGYFGADRRESFFLLSDEQLECIRQTIREIETALLQPVNI